LYHHFPGGKEELAIAAVKWLADDIVQTIRDLRLDGASSPDILETIARSVAGWLIKTDFLQAGLLGALSSGLHHEQSRLRNAIAEAYERIETEYVRMMTVDKMGEAKARSLARTWLVTMEGAILLARVQRDATVVLGALLPVAAQAGCAQR
jgi:TetR/AcrR family transcriptional repressor of lmrAB and yxaGH operons